MLPRRCALSHARGTVDTMAKKKATTARKRNSTCGKPKPEPGTFLATACNILSRRLLLVTRRPKTSLNRIKKAKAWLKKQLSNNGISCDNANETLSVPVPPPLAPPGGLGGASPVFQRANNVEDILCKSGKVRETKPRKASLILTKRHIVRTRPSFLRSITSTRAEQTICSTPRRPARRIRSERAESGRRRGKR